MERIPLVLSNSKQFLPSSSTLLQAGVKSPTHRKFRSKLVLCSPLIQSVEANLELTVSLDKEVTEN